MNRGQMQWAELGCSLETPFSRGESTSQVLKKVTNKMAVCQQVTCGHQHVCSIHHKSDCCQAGGHIQVPGTVLPAGPRSALLSLVTPVTCGQLASVV